MIAKVRLFLLSYTKIKSILSQDIVFMSVDLLNEDDFQSFYSSLFENQRAKYACMYLKNMQAININTLLFLIWLAKTKRGVMSEKQLVRINECIEDWYRRITLPLESLGEKLPLDSQQSLLQCIRVAEADSIQIEQEQLSAYALQLVTSMREPKQQLSDAVKNLKAFSHFYHFTWPQCAHSKLVNLLSEIFCDNDPAFVDKVVQVYLIRKTPHLKSRISERKFSKDCHEAFEHQKK